MGEVDVELALKSAGGYRSAIRSAVRAFWNGTWNWFDFAEEMFRAIRTGFTQAWREGLSAAGITDAEMTDEERIRIEQEIRRETTYVAGFADAIDRGSKANKGSLSPLFRRADYWVAGYSRIRSLAMTYAGNDPKMEWQIDAPKESCSSCKKLDGKVKRASYWKAQGIYPKAWDKLVCRGGCKCGLNVTTKPCTPGPLPSLP